jgi:hypothetical protein
MRSVLSFHTPKVGISCRDVAMVAFLQIEAKTSSTCDSCASEAFQLDEFLLHDETAQSIQKYDRTRQSSR